MILKGKNMLLWLRISLAITKFFIFLSRSRFGAKFPRGIAHASRLFFSVAAGSLASHTGPFWGSAQRRLCLRPLAFFAHARNRLGRRLPSWPFVEVFLHIFFLILVPLLHFLSFYFRYLLFNTVDTWWCPVPVLLCLWPFSTPLSWDCDCVLTAIVYF